MLHTQNEHKTQESVGRTLRPIGAPSGELSTRDVNKLVSAELALEREGKRSTRASGDQDGRGRALLQRAQRKFPGNPKAQVAMFFKEYAIVAGIGSTRHVSARTSTVYSNLLFQIVRELRSQRAAIQNLAELGLPHVEKLIRHWGEQGQLASTIQSKISILRRFLSFIGKGHLIPRGAELKTWLSQRGIDVPVTRSCIAQQSKAWSDHNIDVQQVLRRAYEVCPITGIQLEVQAAFGLRVRESIQLNPVAADYGNILCVTDGTKGGRPRMVALDPDPQISAWQRDVLERAKLFAQRNRKGYLAEPGRSLAQSITHFYYAARVIGITRSALGITAHGLRHQFAARRYQEITGMSAPVTHQAPMTITPQTHEVDLHARALISRQLGHTRPSITRAYVGSLHQLDRQRKAQISDWLQRTEENPRFVDLLMKAGIDAAWLGGRFALGLPTEPQEKLRLIVRTSSSSLRPLGEDVRRTLLDGMNALFERGVDLSQHFGIGEPDEALALNLHAPKAQASERIYKS